MTSTVRSSAALLVVLLTACAAPPPRPVMLPVPARPVLTPLKASALQCLSDSAYTTIVDRERALKTWGLELEATLKANNGKAKP